MAEPVILKTLLLNYLLLFLAVVQRPSPYRKLWFLPILIVNVWLFFHLQVTSGLSVTANTLGCALSVAIFTAADYILLTDVQNEFRLQGDKRYIPSAPLRARMVWAFKLVTTQRGIGWAHEPTGRIRSKPTASRWAFVISRIIRFAYYAVLHDLLQIMMQRNFAVIKGEANYGGTWGWLFERISFLALFFEIPVGVGLSYNGMAALSVTLGLTEPKEWPALMGDWRDAYTVGRFWGRTWHQILRRLLTANSKFVSKKLLRLKSGTSLAWYVQLYAAFTLSGLLHLAGEYKIFGNWTSGGSLLFFVLQAVAITFEDAVINLASRIGWNKTTRASKLVGYVWVLCWMLWTVPSWTGPLAGARIGGLEDKNSVLLAFYQQARRNGTFGF